MRKIILPLTALSLMFSACGQIEDRDDPVRCCYKVKLSPTQIFFSQGFVCLDYPVCPNGETNEADVCDQYCPSPGSELSGTWAVPPLSGPATRIIYDCQTDTLHTEAEPGAGGDEASEGLECSEDNMSIPPKDIHFGAPYHFSLVSDNQDIEIEVGSSSQSPDYVVEGTFYLHDCYEETGTGNPWCQLTLFHLVLETTSSMTFGATTVSDAKVFLAQSATTNVNMLSGAFTFGTDSLVVGASWESGTPAVEDATNVSNGSDAISGVLDLDGTPTITFDGTMTRVGGSVDIIDVAAVIDNQGPVADESNTEQVIDCIPSPGHPHETLATLDASASTDFDANIVEYVWYVDDEPAEVGEVLEVLVDVGIHDVMLIVTDAFGAHSEVKFTLDVDDATGLCD